MRRTATRIGVVVAVLVGAPAAARADNLWLHACSYYSEPGSAFTFSTNGSASTWQGSDSCASPTQEGALQIDTLTRTSSMKYGLWQTVSPDGISIDSAWTPGCTGYCDRQYRGPLIDCALSRNGYEAYFQWNWGGASSNTQRILNHDGSDGTCTYPNSLANGTPIDRGFPATHEFGWGAACENGGGCSGAGATLYMRGIQLGATENRSPALLALGSDNLAYKNGNWVRGGGWSVALQASDPSGACDIRASLNGVLMQGPQVNPDQAVWDQCDPSGAAQRWGGPEIDTTQYPNGTSLQLQYQAKNAAGNWTTSPTSTVHTDNSPVTLTLTGPTSAPVTGKTQYVTAGAGAGPSGVSAIKCSADGGAWTPESLSGGGTSTASAQIPVSGLGSHQVSCRAQNQAYDIAGALGESQTRTWSVKIGEPVRAGITFARVVRHCHSVHVHNRRPVGRAVHCHTATPERRTERVGHGQRASLSGWFATADGTALGHVEVSIMDAPDDGSNQWRRAAVVHTAADGSWHVTVSAGPSRLLRAVYGGGPQTEFANSDTVTLTVPSATTLHLERVVHFGRSAHFSGRLLGGYVPQPGAFVVVEAFDRGHWRSIATVRTDNLGRWRTTYTVNGGSGKYPIRVRIPRQAGYPWAASVTPAQTLIVQP